MAGRNHFRIFSTLCLLLCLGNYHVLADTAYCSGRNCKPDSDRDVQRLWSMQWDRIKEIQDGSLWLPEDLLPTRYAITVEADMTPSSEEDYAYSGFITIYFTVQERTAYILLNVKELTILADDIDLEEKSGGNDWMAVDYVALVSVNTTMEMLALKLTKRLGEGKEYKLRIHFEAPLWPSSQYSRRVYWSKYQAQFNDRSRDSYLVSTHFSPTDARSAFPCFDEPRFKVPVDLNVKYPSLFYKAISNMPVKETLPINQNGVSWSETRFEQTEPIPSYLIAFVICDFLFTEVQAADPQIKVYVPMGEKTPFMSRHVTTIMDRLTALTGQAYTLDKLDIVGLPELSVGAMENWGLVTMRQDKLMADPDTSPVGHFSYSMMTLSHELAHQWFGDRLTPSRWSEVWIKEGPASYYQYRLVNELYPDWPEDELRHSAMLAMIVDDVDSGVVIVSPTPTADQMAVFSSQVYNKASFLLYMLEKACTRPQFDRAMKAFVKDNIDQYHGSVESDNLWNAINANTNMTEIMKDDRHADVNSYMKPWFEQSGFPVVSLSLVGDDMTRLHATQVPMEGAMDPPHKKGDSDEEDEDDDQESDKTWPVPLFFDEAQQHLNVTWIFDKAQNASYNTTASRLLHTLIPHGFYRVNFSENLWDRLRWELLINHEMFSPISRAHFIGDIFAFVECCHGYLVHAMETTQYLLEKEESNPLVWQYVDQAYKYPIAMLKGLSERNDMVVDKYMQRLLAHIYNEVGWRYYGVEDDRKRQVQSIVLLLACQHGIENCISYADYYFDNWAGDHENGWSRIDPAWRDAVFCRGVDHGGERAWNDVFKFIQSGVSYLDDVSRGKLAKNLACSVEMAEKYAEILILGDELEEEVRNAGVKALAKTAHGWRHVWKHLTANGTNITLSDHVIEQATKSIVHQFKTQQHLAMLRAQPDVAESLIKRAEYNIGWLRHNEKEAINWMEMNGSTIIQAASLASYILLAALISLFHF